MNMSYVRLVGPSWVFSHLKKTKRCSTSNLKSFNILIKKNNGPAQTVESCIHDEAKVVCKVQVGDLT